MDDDTRNKVKATLSWALKMKATLEAEKAYVESCLGQEGLPPEDLQLSKYEEAED